MSYIFFFFIFASRCCDFFLFFYFLLFICLTLTHSARCEYCARASGKHSPCKYMQIRNTHGGRTRVYIHFFFLPFFFFISISRYLFRYYFVGNGAIVVCWLLLATCAMYFFSSPVLMCLSFAYIYFSLNHWNAFSFGPGRG